MAFVPFFCDSCMEFKARNANSSKCRSLLQTLQRLTSAFASLSLRRKKMSIPDGMIEVDGEWVDPEELEAAGEIMDALEEGSLYDDQPPVLNNLCLACQRGAHEDCSYQTRPSEQCYCTHCWGNP